MTSDERRSFAVTGIFSAVQGSAQGLIIGHAVASVTMGKPPSVALLLVTLGVWLCALTILVYWGLK